jgi:phosphoribosylanthranilate isomerase
MPVVEVKICGITRLDDARGALDAGADYVGFVLYSGSPRGIGFRRLRAIADRLPARCRAVGVFVNEPRGTVERVAADCGLYAVQLHGDERPEDFACLTVRVWRVVRLGRGPSARAPAEGWRVERFGVDAAVAGRYGGTGTAADWRAAAAFAARRPAMLAGGLTPRNVARAVRAVRPLGVDTASGVESAPGRKNLAKVRRFVAAAKEAAADGEA